MQIHNKDFFRFKPRLQAVLLNLIVVGFSVLPVPLIAAEIGKNSALHKPLNAVNPKSIPQLVLQDLDEQIVRVQDLAKEGLLVVNFWATWCPPCRAEMGSLEKLHQHLQEASGGKAQVIGINVGEDVDTIFAFLGEVSPSPNFLQLLDPESKAVDAWGVKGLPTTFVVNRQGEIVYRVIGGREFQSPVILEQLEQLMR